jgi:thiamine biosynthesis lipoprotein
MRLLLCISLLIASQLCVAKWHGDAQDIMGTKVSVALWLEDDQKAEQAVAAVMAEMRRIDEHFSPYIETSELSRANQLAPKASAKKPLSISPELAAIIDKSRHYSELSDGAFDITFASLGRYYDYRNKLTPSEQQREELLPAINYRLIHLDTKNNTLWFEHPKVYLDLGGIAKGYAVDKAIEVLQSFGVKHASVTAGGDSRVIGDKFGRPSLSPPRAITSATLSMIKVSACTTFLTRAPANRPMASTASLSSARSGLTQIRSLPPCLCWVRKRVWR